jgi:hypothetical protein
MNGCGFFEGLGGTAPDHDDPVAVVFLLEVCDIGHQLFGQIHFVLAGLHVWAVDSLYVLVIEDGFHGLDGRQIVFQFVEQRLVENTGMGGGFVSVVFIDVPAAEDEVAKVARGTKSLIFGVRFSVRLPRRTVPSCVREPTGSPSPSLTASTPAMKVVATAPMPGIRMPRRPVAGATLALFGIDILFGSPVNQDRGGNMDCQARSLLGFAPRRGRLS